MDAGCKITFLSHASLHIKAHSRNSSLKNENSVLIYVYESISSDERKGRYSDEFR